jgi:hypothetical protein
MFELGLEVLLAAMRAAPGASPPRIAVTPKPVIRPKR